MANILGKITANNPWYIEVDADPGAGGGTASPLSTVAVYNGNAYIKTGVSNTDWSIFVTSLSAWNTSGNTLTGSSPSTPDQEFGSANDFDVVQVRNNVEVGRFGASNYTLDQGSLKYDFTTKSLEFDSNTTGTLVNSGTASLVHGQLTNGSISSTGTAQIVSGTVASATSSIAAIGEGSMIKGVADDITLGTTARLAELNTAAQPADFVKANLIMGEAEGFAEIITDTEVSGLTFNYNRANIVNGLARTTIAAPASGISRMEVRGGGNRLSGYAEDGGKFLVVGFGNAVNGIARPTTTPASTSSGNINVWGNSNILSATTFDGGTARIGTSSTTSSSNSMVLGIALTSGVLGSGGSAHFVVGTAQNSGQVVTGTSGGSFLVGRANGVGSTVTSTGTRSVVFGTSNSAGCVITGSNTACFINGLVSGATSSITASGICSTVFAQATGTATILANGQNSMIVGFNDISGSLTASGTASSIHGRAQNGTISATGIASRAIGYAHDTGSIQSSGNASFAGGNCANAGSLLVSSALGGFVYGSVTGGARIDGDPGSGAGVAPFVMGRAQGSGTGPSQLRSFATAWVGGHAQSGGKIECGGDGSLLIGDASSDGQIRNSSSVGSIAVGRVNGTNSLIENNGTGSAAFGQATSGGIIRANNTSIAYGYAQNTAEIQSTTGSFGGGYADGAGSKIRATNGSLAIGYAEAGGDIRAIVGVGCFAAGRVSTLGVINAEANGAHASGDALTNTIAATATGSFAHGYSQNANIIASGIGSFALGYAQTGVINVSGAGGFVAGDDISQTAQFAQSFGLGHSNTTYGSMYLGRYSVDPVGTPTVWSSTEPVFVIGNGASSVARANAFQIDKDGVVTETAALHQAAVRVANAATTVDARADRTIVFDTTGTSGNFTLPASPPTGTTFYFAPQGIGAAAYTLVPSGGNTIDANVITNLIQGVSSGIIYRSGTWYSLYSIVDSTGELTFQVTTTGASTASISIPIPTNTNKLVKTSVVGRQTGGTTGSVGDGAGFVRTLNTSNSSGTVTNQFEQNDYTYTTVIGATLVAGTSGANVTYDITGVADRNVTWDVKVSLVI